MAIGSNVWDKFTRNGNNLDLESLEMGCVEKPSSIAIVIMISFFVDNLLIDINVVNPLFSKTDPIFATFFPQFHNVKYVA